jgi:hypothetical protein
MKPDYCGLPKVVFKATAFVFFLVALCCYPIILIIDLKRKKRDLKTN